MIAWSVPRIWEGKTVAVLASGPSLTEPVVDAVCASGCPTIAVNTSYRRAPWADVLYAADVDWWQEYKGAQDFDGFKVSCSQAKKIPYPDVHVLEVTGASGIDMTPTKIRTGSNGAYQAMHIAIQAGASKVIFVGLDMHGGHWHPEYPSHMKQNDKPTFEKFISRFNQVAPVAEALGVDLVNCTPGSALTCFRFGALEEELAGSFFPFDSRELLFLSSPIGQTARSL